MEKDVYQVRASSIAEFADCPARWMAKNIDRDVMPTHWRAHTGSAFHAGTAIYDSRQGTADDGLGVALDYLRDSSIEEVAWENQSAERIESMLTALYYSYIENIGKPRRGTWHAVEMTLSPLRLDVGPIIIELTGTVDRVRTFTGQYGVSDVKSGLRAVSSAGVAKTKGHGAQIGAYELLVANTMNLPVMDFLPGEIIGCSTGSRPHVSAAELPDRRNIAGLVGDADRPGWLYAIGAAIATGIFTGNPNSYLCSGKFCPRHDQGCVFSY